MIPKNRIQAMLGGDLILTSIIAILFMYFTYSASKWVERMEELAQAKEVMSGDIRVIKAEEAARYEALLKRLDTIDSRLTDLQKRQ